MVDAYINIGKLNKGIIINYFLKKNENSLSRTTGFNTSASNLEEAKEMLEGIIYDCSEKEIEVTSKDQSQISKYTKIGLEKLKEIKKFLSDKRKDITFIL